MLNQYFGCFLKRFFRLYGTIRGYFDEQLLVVGFLLDTEILNGVFYITDRSVYRIDRKTLTALQYWRFSSAGT